MGHCQPTPLKETLTHSQVDLAQSPVGSLFLSPGSWCTQGIICALQEWSLCFPTVLWESCNQILMAFKDRFPGDSQSLCWVPGLESLMWGLGITVLQFVVCPPNRFKIWFLSWLHPSHRLVEASPLSLDVRVSFFWWVPVSSCCCLFNS